MSTTIANGWQIELFCKINNANNYQRVVVFSILKPGTGAEYLYDDIELVSGAETLVLPLTFESAKLTYSFEI
jgi:hypothetical protein